MAKSKPDQSQELATPVPQFDATAAKFQDEQLGATPIRIRRLQPEQVQALRERAIDVTVPKQAARLIQVATVSRENNFLLYPGEQGVELLCTTYAAEELARVATAIATFNAL